tara:strand:- start:15 stop:194 length:180 start_codon:yes stop_codon:yes gene_type:complete
VVQAYRVRLRVEACAIREEEKPPPVARGGEEGARTDITSPTPTPSSHMSPPFAHNHLAP